MYSEESCHEVLHSRWSSLICLRPPSNRHTPSSSSPFFFFLLCGHKKRRSSVKIYFWPKFAAVSDTTSFLQLQIRIQVFYSKIIKWWCRSTVDEGTTSRCIKYDFAHPQKVEATKQSGGERWWKKRLWPFQARVRSCLYWRSSRMRRELFYFTLFSLSPWWWLRSLSCVLDVVTSHPSLSLLVYHP